jgi:hypothetical protein
MWASTIRNEQPDLDDTQDAGDADHLDAVRRAVAMDRGDKDMLPDFGSCPSRAPI